MAHSTKTDTKEQGSAGKDAVLSFVDAPSAQFSINPVQPSPCAQACPAGVNVKGYVGLIAAEKFDEALELIKRDNPLPGICGRVCHHPCEAFCRRSDYDDPVAICWLKRFVADYELQRSPQKVEALPQTRQERIAIIGSGPAGLTAANDLIRLGYGVTVYEALPEPGGMLAVGIPAYRLPRDIIRKEIDAIRDLGVEIKTNVKIGEDLTIAELLQEHGHQAVFVAVGAHIARQLGIPGEEGTEGVYDCMAFLERANAGDRTLPGRRILIIGGGHSAVDCARTALRLGGDYVGIVYRRSREEMPAGMVDVNDAESEGVDLTLLASPLEIVKQGNRMVGLKCIRNELGEPDASGRRRPLPVTGSEFVIDADVVISAINQAPDLTVTEGQIPLDISKWKTIAAEDESLATNIPGVFAGGDAVTGPNTVIEAMAHGHRGARSIHFYLNERQRTPIASEDEVMTRVREWEVTPRPAKIEHRAAMPRIPMEMRKADFEEVDLGFAKEVAVEEAKRCLRCGPCSECTICVPTCPRSHVLISVPGGPPELRELMIRVPKDDQQFPAIEDCVKAEFAWPAEITDFQKDGVEPAADVKPLASEVRTEYCRGCGTCVEVCDYGAATLVLGADGLWLSRIDETVCKGCGVCSSVCPSSAIQAAFGDEETVSDLMQWQADESPVVVFGCNWNGVEQQSISDLIRQRSSTSICTVPVMCSGRISPAMILKAFEKGAGGVILARCASDQCHYGFGSRIAEENIATARQILHLLGIEPQRLQSFCPDEEDHKWGNIVDDFDLMIAKIQQVYPVETGIKAGRCNDGSN